MSYIFIQPQTSVEVTIIDLHRCNFSPLESRLPEGQYPNSRLYKHQNFNSSTYKCTIMLNHA